MQVESKGLKQYKKAREIGRIKVEVKKNNPNLSEKQAVQIAAKNYKLRSK